MDAPGYARTLGERLKHAREIELRAGFRELERRLEREGIEASHVSIARYERGERVPPADYVVAVARMAGLSAGWLLAGEGPRRPTSPGKKEAAFDQVAEIIRRANRGEIE